MGQLVKFMFNKSVENPMNGEAIKTMGLDTISSAGGANGAEGTYSLPKKYKPLFELKDGLFRLLDNWKDWRPDDTLTPFELLVALKHKSEAEAINYLKQTGWDARPIDDIVFPNGKFNATNAVEFAVADGFVRIDEANRDEIQVFYNNGGVLEPFNVKANSVNYFASKIKDPLLKNKLHSVRGQVVAIWQLMDGVPYNLQLDDRHNIYLPFRGKVIHVTKDKISEKEYKDLALFTPTESMKHDFDYTDEAGMFEKFLTYGITGSDKPDTWSDTDKRNILAFMTAVGYLLSTYRDPSLNKAIIFSDFGADGEARNGRRGKSLILVSIALLRNTLTKPDDTFKTDYQFRFGDFNVTIRVVNIDDAPKNFNWYSLFTAISGALSCERKGKPSVEIKYSQTPKWAITTNFVVPFQTDEESVKARYAEYQIRPFWNATNTPRDYFKSNFFSEEWDKKEWDKFYSFMVRCSQSFLKHGLLEIEIDKKESRYLAYIGNNEAKLVEMERILFELSGYSSFKVDDFLKVHYKNIEMRYDRLPIWNHNTVRRDLDIWIEYHNLDYRYSQRGRAWEKIDNPIDGLDSIAIDEKSVDELPF